MLAKFFTLALAATASVNALSQGFNYASTKADGSARVEADFEADFNAAKSLAGTSGFTSARLYTMIQAGSATDPIQAITAAMKTKTTLLLGMWCSAGSTIVDNEIAALKNAVSLYGKDFTDLIVGISVGSEDLYRSSALGVAAKAGIGADAATITGYITKVKSALSDMKLSVPVGHVDTWTAWVDTENTAVIDAVDWIGVDAYPYFQSNNANDISLGGHLFFEALDNTKAVSQGKPVWVSETGWPTEGKLSGQAVASIANAKSYWEQVACKLIGQVNLYWYTLSDYAPGMTDPSFGIVGADLSSGPLYDLSCSAQNITSSSSSASSSSSMSATSSASSTSSTGAISSSASTTSAAELGSPGGMFSAGVSVTTSASSSMITSNATAPGSASGSAIATYPHVTVNGSSTATSMPTPSQAMSAGSSTFVSLMAVVAPAVAAFYAAYLL